MRQIFFFFADDVLSLRNSLCSLLGNKLFDKADRYEKSELVKKKHPAVDLLILLAVLCTESSSCK